MLGIVVDVFVCEKCPDGVSNTVSFGYLGLCLPDITK
jgi:hypothetical protein